MEGGRQDVCLNAFPHKTLDIFLLFNFNLLTTRTHALDCTGFGIPCQWNVDSGFQSLARFRTSRRAEFRNDWHNMADFQRDIHYIILQCGSRNQSRKQDIIPWLPRQPALEVLSYNTIQYNTIQILLLTPHGGFSETSINSTGNQKILGNAYIAPATSLHLTFSIESRTFVVIFAFFL